MVLDYALAPHWFLVTTILGFFVSFYLMGVSNNRLLRGQASMTVPTILLAVGCVLWLGCRPLWAYGDTHMYVVIFNLKKFGGLLASDLMGDEWIWGALREWFINHSDAHSWLLAIEVLYIGLAFVALWKWMPKHVFLAFMFFILSFSFFTYGTNGIRNGLATSCALLGLSFINLNSEKGRTLFWAIGLTTIYLSSFIHTSLLLVFGASIIALFYRHTNVYVTCWLGCIFLSLVFTEPLKELLSNLINDQRAAYYLTMNTSSDSLMSDESFSRSGFRWDFILYSAVPVALGYYAIVKKGVQDATYIFLTNVYIIANSFWCLINSAAYSNRFAYLSWFLMPILICYPLVKFRLFGNQGLVCGMFLLGSVIFNWLF